MISYTHTIIFIKYFIIHVYMRFAKLCMYTYISVHTYVYMYKLDYFMRSVDRQ